ncbi:hypothetical protein CS0771_40480 [Catellatospora sp. IY07-71]|uniref:hypothetical protein n=1 Tax=Catellatospora sp. IY07-71 TaxID=2728827 RepID=UPI001BB39854|nr:hypothetical protein [Catellatospora sp. IY07-71]BCJ74504.1 hypothetical protein CS0771_40480 [Catellatospora sp. IY07-71]
MTQPTDTVKNTVKDTLTIPAQRTRTRGAVENREFAAFARRIIRAHARRVASGDVEALTDLVALSTAVDQAITDAVTGLKDFGYSWTEIANRIGISKQAAQQRWGQK